MECNRGQGGSLGRSSAIATLLVVTSLMGCQRAWYGSGGIYIWNGTMRSIGVVVDGRTAADVELFAHMGKHLDDVIAGPYHFEIGTADGSVSESVTAKVFKDRLTLVNVRREGCFVRADVSGMYRPDRRRVRVLEVYDRPSVIEFRDNIEVLPGQMLPVSKPRSPFAFQRLAVVDCDLIQDDLKVEKFVLGLR